jgi:beta-lactamase superfamily II metal-dependent hydrolase
MNIYFYQAECGDAARIRFIGADSKPHNIFIDFGFDRTFRHVLAEQIESLYQSGEIIDLAIISHIHSDHIGGALAFTNAVVDGEFIDSVQRWFYNLPRTPSSRNNNLSLISEAKSISEGDRLVKYLASKNKLPQKDITTTSPVIDFHGMMLTVLSPNPQKLEQLRKKYGADSKNPLEEIEGASISEAKAPPPYDYHIPLTSFDLTKWEEDKSIENGSSIAVLTEFHNKKVLWLADAHPSIIAKSLQQLGFTKSNPIVCEYVKVTHHGSKGNNSDELYSLIRCSNYIISANGENNSALPTKECISRILRNPNRPLDLHYNFYFTYDNSTLRNIFEVDGSQVFEQLNFSVIYLNTEKFLVFESIHT